MNEPENSPEHLLDLFGEDLTRQILLLTSDTPMSADALADELDVSLPTVYRHVNDLVQYGILHEVLEMNPNGHHYRTFKLALNEISFRIDDGQLTITVEMDESLVDKFDGFLSGLETSYVQASGDTNEQLKKADSQNDPHYG